MACSGINEHKEGCRKQRVLDRAAHARKLRMSGLMEKEIANPPVTVDDPEAPGYMRKMGSPPGITGSPFVGSYEKECFDKNLMEGHSPTAIDRLRRDGVRAQQLVAYSAKIPNRLSIQDIFFSF